MLKINTASILSDISSKTSKGTKPFKAITSTFYKHYGKVSLEGLENKINDKFPTVLNTFAITDSVEEINRVYREVSHSCMFGRNVGAFYVREGYECAYCLDGRAIIDPVTKTFVKSYGPNHYILESILTLMGYTKSDCWTRPMNMEVDVLSISYSDIPKIIDHYRGQLGDDFERVYGDILAYEDFFPDDGSVGIFFYDQFSRATYYSCASGEELFYSDLDGFIPYQVSDETIVAFIPYIDGKKVARVARVEEVIEDIPFYSDLGGDDVTESVLLDFEGQEFLPDFGDSFFGFDE